MGLGEPHRIKGFAAEALMTQMLKSCGNVTRLDEEIQVLGHTPNTGVFLQCKSASNSVENPVLVHCEQYIAIELRGFNRQSDGTCRSHRRSIRRFWRVFGHEPLGWG